jgi:hypothetical protein
MTRKLGRIQELVLDALRRHGKWTSDYTCGWTWNGAHRTGKIMESLVRKGYATKEATKVNGRDVILYKPTSENKP